MPARLAAEGTIPSLMPMGRIGGAVCGLGRHGERHAGAALMRTLGITAAVRTNG